MKKTILTLIAVAAVVFTASAQTVKYGIVKTDEILAIMPDTDSARVKVEAKYKELEKELMDMQADFQKKMEAYQKGAASFSDAMRAQKEKELNDISNTIKEFQGIAQQEVQMFQQKQMEPVYSKVTAAIEAVANAGGVTFVMDASQTPFIYYNKTIVTDITESVKKNLGI